MRLKNQRYSHWPHLYFFGWCLISARGSFSHQQFNCPTTQCRNIFDCISKQSYSDKEINEQDLVNYSNDMKNYNPVYGKYFDILVFHSWIVTVSRQGTLGPINCDWFSSTNLVKYRLLNHLYCLLLQSPGLACQDNQRSLSFSFTYLGDAEWLVPESGTYSGDARYGPPSCPQYAPSAGPGGPYWL